MTKVELRGEIPREVVDVLDAVAQARRVSRMEIVSIVLSQWAQERALEATLIQRVTRGNPFAPDPTGAIR